MIIFRYLFKEILFSMSAVTGVLMLIIMSGRFIKYLTNAAAGKYPVEVLFPLMLYRVPGFLELILPLGLFLGILLAYGRLYTDNEMTVLTACGFSQRRLQWLTLGAALPVVLMVALLSLWGTPWGALQVERIFLQQESLTEFDTLAPGRFQSLAGGTRVTYTEELVDERTRLKDVFISEQSGLLQERDLAVLVADSGRQVIDEETGSRFLLLENGYRYEGVPGEADYRKIRFKEYGVKLAETRRSETVSAIETLTTQALLDPKAWPSESQRQAQLQWRISLPLLCLIVTLIAVPLSKVNPRQGRFLRLLPCILLYLCYLTLLTSARSAMEKGNIPAPLGLWWVHGVFLLIAVNIHLFPRFWKGLWQKCLSCLPGGWR